MKKWIIGVIIFVVAIVLVICGINYYHKDSRGKTFEASLDHNKVMMQANWKAQVNLKANKGATYKVEDNSGKTIKGKSTTKNGKATITFNEPGTYTVIAKSDNGHVSKKMDVKVTHFKKAINKTMTAVGPMVFKIVDVDYQKVSKKKLSTDISFDDNTYKNLNKYCYQVVISYIIQNTGTKPVDPQYTMWTPIVDSGLAFSESGSALGFSTDSIIGTETIGAKNSRTGYMYLMSNKKFSVQNLKIHVDEVIGKNANTIAKGGDAVFKEHSTSN